MPAVRHEALVQLSWCQCRKRIVPGEKFVPTVTRKRNSNAPSREAAEQERRHDRGITQRFVQTVQHLGNEHSGTVHVERVLLVSRTKRLADRASIGMTRRKTAR